MNKCHVFHPERARGEEQVSLNFWGNRPALPPLTTESVTSVVYLVDDEPTGIGGDAPLQVR